MSIKLPLLAILSAITITPSYGQAPNYYRDRGVGLGAILGGLTGAAVGKNNGNTAAGAAIGLAAGALGGAALGDSMDTDVARSTAYAQQQAAQQAYQAQAARAATMQDVISMSQARLSDQVIITHIQTSGVAYRPQPHELITLSQNGVSDAVIAALQTAPLATAPAPMPQTVYRERVVVEPRYVVPVYPRPYYHHACPPVYRHHPYHHGSGVHWGVTIRN
jgi:uncharacterized protein YcfJ